MPDLSARERQVLRHMAEGDTNAEIGAKLYLSPFTIRCHVTRICRCLGARTRAHAVHIAHQRGLLGASAHT